MIILYLIIIYSLILYQYRCTYVNRLTITFTIKHNQISIKYLNLIIGNIKYVQKPAWL